VLYARAIHKEEEQVATVVLPSLPTDYFKSLLTDYFFSLLIMMMMNVFV